MTTPDPNLTNCIVWVWQLMNIQPPFNHTGSHSKLTDTTAYSLINLMTNTHPSFNHSGSVTQNWPILLPTVLLTWWPTPTHPSTTQDQWLKTDQYYLPTVLLTWWPTPNHPSTTQDQWLKTDQYYCLQSWWPTLNHPSTTQDQTQNWLTLVTGVLIQWPTFNHPSTTQEQNQNWHYYPVLLT